MELLDNYVAYTVFPLGKRACKLVGCPPGVDRVNTLINTSFKMVHFEGCSEFKTWTGYGYVWCKNLTLETISRDTDDHVNVGPVSFNWGYKRTIEDDMQLAVTTLNASI